MSFIFKYNKKKSLDISIILYDIYILKYYLNNKNKLNNNKEKKIKI